MGTYIVPDQIRTFGMVAANCHSSKRHKFAALLSEGKGGGHSMGRRL